jgi:hypothetical protein
MTTKTPVYGIKEREDGIARALFPKVRDYLMLLGDVYTISGEAFAAAYPDRDVPLDKMVATKLMIRLNNDLRAVSMLAEVGYDAQANALAASVYEGSFTIATITDDATLADAWLKHEDPVKTWRDAKSLTLTGLKKFGSHSNWADPMYQVYRQFCWGKHLNPIAEQQGGIERSKEGIDYIPGPRDDELTERGVCFSCNHTVMFALIGAEMFVRHYVLNECKAYLSARLKELGNKWQELHKRAFVRWGCADPFPGKW